MAERRGNIGNPIAILRGMHADLEGLLRSVVDPGKFAGRWRSLEIMVCNLSQTKTLVFDEEHFDTGTWYCSPKPLTIEPGNFAIMCVANRSKAWTGVTGGLRYHLKGTDKYLYLGFCNPYVGSIKTFISVEGNKPASWAYDNCADDSVKMHVREGYRVTATLLSARIANRLIEYTIREEDE